MEVTTLNRRRGGIKSQLTKLTKFVSDEMEISDEIDIVNKIETVCKIENKLDDLKLDYYKCLKDEDVDACEIELDGISEDLQKMKVSLKRYLGNKQKGSDIVNKSNNCQKLAVNLPYLSLPKYEGGYENWNNFKTQFNSIIDSNDLLTSDQKLFYLQSALIGKAKQIQSVDDTYESLWQALHNRYENKRLIINSHMKSILSLECIAFESPEKLRFLLDTVLKDVRALKVMNIEINNFSEHLLINIIMQKLDKATCKEYEMSLTFSELPTWNNFISFLEARCILLENIQRNSYQLKPKPPQNKLRNFALNSKNSVCKVCKKSHELYNCELFLKMNPLQRFDLVKRHKLCINCLSDKHILAYCNSKYVCKCKSKHNYLLCRSQGQIKEPSNSPNSESMATPEIEFGRKENSETNKIDHNVISPHLTSCFMSERKNVILATAVIYVKNNYGRYFKCRGILDSGSMINAISSSFANCLGLKQQNINTSIFSLAGKEINVNKKMNAIISNHDNSFQVPIEFVVIPKVTEFLPSTELNISQFNFPNVNLADPEFYKPGKLDILIGAELFFNIVKNETINISESLILKETVFGFIVSGSIKTNNNNTKYCGFMSQLDELHERVKMFWETENLEDTPSSRDEEIKCEEHFSKFHSRDKLTGRYIVTLPLKDDFKLGDSYTFANARLENLWKKLNKNIEMKELYVQFMEEYLSLGHMREIEFSDSVKYVIPHFAILRADSSTSKLRVVFDASALSSNGVSLNECLLKGGIVQEDLFSILLRFRKNKFAFVADIKKMYRQILVNPDQCNLQCILWKSNPMEEAKLFQLLTVTYGTTCAPFLATRTVKQLAIDEREHYPLASSVALSDVYVDDILTGSEDIQGALELQNQLIEMFRSAGMELHKWCSNEKILLDQVPLSRKEYDFDENKCNSVKTLGLRWDPKEDNFFFNVSSSDEIPTKRSVLSEIARLYDPLGLLGPVITQAKLFLQTLWKLNLEWNQEIPKLERNKWENFRRKLVEIKNVTISRFVLADCVNFVEIHGFSDASKEAYGAVVYLRCINSTGEIKVSLLCSKSRISPLKEVTIPRLELCGAVLLAKLIKKVTDSLKISIDGIYLWTDSQIVLAWIVKPLPQLKLFVKNRVSVIKSLTELKCWRHIGSKDNPADLISRGVDPDKIKNCQLWWIGPPFLYQNLKIEPSSVLPVEETDLYTRELKELPDVVSGFVQKQSTLDIVNNCSSFTKLKRVIAWCLRFLKNSQGPSYKTVGCLSSQELSNALTCLVKIVQSTAFPDELQCLMNNKAISNSSHLLTLSPFLDSEGVIRVGGRLKNSNLSVDHKNPILLPNNHNFTYIVINHYHVSYFHIGPEGTQAFIRTKFWIVHGRNIIRKLIKKCITCLKVSSKPSQQVMADLPSARVNPSKVFSQVGLDFGGPFTVKTFAGRNKKLNKCYICIFICLAVKAVHFEIVHNLTTEAFLGAL